MPLPRYDSTQTYAWNYQHAPEPLEVPVPPCPGRWDYCGLSVASPLGIPAGPLLNGRWLLHYAALGFDSLTYKTVRGVPRGCYPLPNLQPVRTGQLRGDEGVVPVALEMTGSWAVSFGMPSQPPDVWRADVEATRRKLPAGKVLAVSVVGTIEEGWTIDHLADDYARCARWAVESGADVVETNFSCPNVSTCDGQLYQSCESAALVAARVRQAIGRTPYVLKIGRFSVPAEEAAVEAPGGDVIGPFLSAVAPYADALAMTNSVAARVALPGGKYLFDGQPRGICGEATRHASLLQVRLFSQAVQALGLPLKLVGVGGASTAEHVRQYLAAGAHAVHLATAAMLDPLVGIKIREEMARWV